MITPNQWVTAYYAGWTKWNAVPVDISDIDFSTATHWIFFTLGPQSNGTFDGTGSGIDAQRHQEFVNAAHAAGKKAIIGTGGWGSDYTGVVTNRAVSIPALISLMDTYGYDGVDIDWEPVPANQYANFSAFVQELKAARPSMLLLAACFNFDQAVVNNKQYFDQINLMTYDMSGAWSPFSWHNSALKGVPGVGSIEDSINLYTAAGVEPSKIGFGIEIYAYVWNGVTGPQQSPYGSIQNTVPYWTVMNDYYEAGAELKFDPVGQAYYYSTPSQFVSMDFEDSMQLKADYLASKGLGGVILYEVGVSKVLSQTPQDRILQQVKHAFLGGPALPPLPYIAPPPPPEKKSYVIYQDSVQSGFWNSSWITGGNINTAADDPVNVGNKVISVHYSAWDGVRFHTGSTWGDQYMIASDQLSFDIFPVGSAFNVTVLIEGGIARVFNAPRDKWTKITVPCPPTSFSWFYLQNNTSSIYDVMIDNVVLTSTADPGSTTSTTGSATSSTGSSTATYQAGYTKGFADGVASINTQQYYDQGFAAGTTSGYATGYSAGYSQGYAAGVQSVDTQQYYDQGFAAGEASVDTQAYYDSGYAAGLADGSSKKSGMFDSSISAYKYFSKSVTEEELSALALSGLVMGYMGSRSATTLKVPVRGWLPA